MLARWMLSKKFHVLMSKIFPAFPCVPQREWEAGVITGELLRAAQAQPLAGLWCQVCSCLLKLSHILCCMRNSVIVLIVNMVSP